MTSFTDRMIGAAKLDVRVYEEVEADTGATRQAMGVVLLASLAGGVGTVGLSTGSLGSVVIGGIAGLIGWVTWAFVTYIIGTRLLPESQTRANVGELMRTIGFAQSPAVLRILGGLSGVGPLVFSLTQVWLLVTMVVAVRQALDYSSTLRAVGVCLIGWVLSTVIAIGLVLLLAGNLRGITSQ